MNFKFLINGVKNYEYSCSNIMDIRSMLNDLKTATISSAVHSSEYEDMCFKFGCVSFRYDINTSKYVCFCCSPLDVPFPIMTSLTYKESVKYIQDLNDLHKLLY